MLVVLSDTHSADDPLLHGRTAEAVAAADRVVHAGDLTAAAVLDGLDDAAGGPVHAVHGNADEAAVRERLPATRTLAYAGVRIVVTHAREGGPTALSMLGRAREAALVVSGHTHRPAVVEGPPTLLNPGSHAAPRGGAPATHAELRPAGDAGGLDGTVRATDGTVVERFAVGGDETGAE